MFLTSTGCIIAQLTRYGRQILADNSANFKIAQYQFSDDEINYTNFDGSSIDAPNLAILSTPILEANSFGKTPTQRYSLFSKPNNTLQVARIDADIGLPFVDGAQNERPERNRALLALNSDIYNANNPFKFIVRTLYGYDSYYLISDNAGFLGAGGPQIEPALSVPVKGQQIKEKIVYSFTQSPTTYPCTDPFECLQNQSQAEIQIIVDIQHSDNILANFALGEHLDQFLRSFNLNSENLGLKLNGSFSEEQIINAWRSYIKNRINKGHTLPPDSPWGPMPFIDTYTEVGMAVSDITIRGSDTGKLFTVSCLIYSSSILSHILKSVL